MSAVKAQAEICGNVEGLALLDVGCGSGYFSRQMARRGARVRGVDSSPRMVALARDLEAAVRARPALADATRVPYWLMFDLSVR